MDRILRIRTGRHPHEILIVSVTVLLGVIGAISPTRISSAVASEFAWPWAMVFWVSMAVTGGIALWGIFNKKIEGLLVERAGLTLQATVYGVYIYVVAQFAGTEGLVSMMLPAAFAAGNLYRCWQIKTDLALLTSYLKDHPGEQVR